MIQMILMMKTLISLNKFYTVSNSRTEKSSGLGLAITKELVYKINGQISIDYKNEEITFILKLKQYMEH